MISTTVTDLFIALIGATAAILGALARLIVAIRRGRRENADQHADNKQAFQQAIGELGGKIDVMHTDVRHVADRLDNHMRDHAPTIAAVEVPEPRRTTSSTASRPRKKTS